MKKLLSVLLGASLLFSVATSSHASSTVPPPGGSAIADVEEETLQYAYMDIDEAMDQVEAQILAARNQIIFSQNWSADGCDKIYAGHDYRKLTESCPGFYDTPGQCFPLSHSPVSVHPASGTQNGGRPATSTIRLGTAAIHGTNNDCENYV